MSAGAYVMVDWENSHAEQQQIAEHVVAAATGISVAVERVVEKNGRDIERIAYCDRRLFVVNLLYSTGVASRVVGASNNRGPRSNSTETRFVV